MYIYIYRDTIVLLYKFSLCKRNAMVINCCDKHLDAVPQALEVLPCLLAPAKDILI